MTNQWFVSCNIVSGSSITYLCDKETAESEFELLSKQEDVNDVWIGKVAKQYHRGENKG